MILRAVGEEMLGAALDCLRLRAAAGGDLDAAGRVGAAPGLPSA